MGEFDTQYHNLRSWRRVALALLIILTVPYHLGLYSHSFCCILTFCTFMNMQDFDRGVWDLAVALRLIWPQEHLPNPATRRLHVAERQYAKTALRHTPATYAYLPQPPSFLRVFSITSILHPPSSISTPLPPPPLFSTTKTLITSLL